MSLTTSSKFFDLSVYAVAGASYLYNWTPIRGNSFSALLCGAQSFAIVSIFDKALKYFLLRNVQKESVSVQQAVISPIIEETIYSGVLLTQGKLWIIPRFASSLITGMTAARSLTGRVSSQQNSQGLTLDTKIGFLWATSRELLLFTLPYSYLSTPLIVADSCVFALSEVSPKNGHPDIPKFSPAWSYKVLSSFFFRLTANAVAQKYGIVASIAQHLFFNISSFLENKNAFSPHFSH